MHDKFRSFILWSKGGSKKHPSFKLGTSWTSPFSFQTSKPIMRASIFWQELKIQIFHIKAFNDSTVGITWEARLEKLEDQEKWRLSFEPFEFCA